MKRKLLLFIILLPVVIFAEDYIDTLNNGTPRQKVEAMYQLGYAGNKKAFWYCVKYLSYIPNKNDSVDAVKVREASAEALGRIKDKRAVKYLIRQYRSEKVLSVKRKIIFALSFYKDDTAIPIIKEALTIKEEGMHFEALLAAAKYQKNDFKSLLLSEFSNSKSILNKTTAAYGLLLLEPNTSDYKNYLIESLKDEEPSVRYWAVHYIRLLKMIDAEKAIIKALEIENIFWVENEMDLTLQVIYYEKYEQRKKNQYSEYEFILN